MSTERLTALDYIRGISMLGVIGIHTGAEYLTNPHANIHLVAFFEILTRFSVPIFFFISAFGLFYNRSILNDFNYFDFLKKRFKVILIPYLTWTFFYICFNHFFYYVGFPNLKSLFVILFLGTAKYQLYFLVILLWFYLLMPFWIYLLKNMSLPRLFLLLLLQLSFNYFSSYLLWGITISNPILKKLIDYRLNYWVFHYIFIFILGGYLSLHREKFFEIIHTKKRQISLFFFCCLACILAYYYKLVIIEHYRPEWAVNTAHQLSPFGVFYTIAASIFFFMFFSTNHFSKPVNFIFSFLGNHSFFVYLFHPVILAILVKIIGHLGLIITAPIAIFLYIGVLILSLLTAHIIRKIGIHYSLINKLTIGTNK